MTKNIETETYNWLINTIKEAREFNNTLYAETEIEVNSLNLSHREAVYMTSAIIARKKENFGKSRLLLAEKFTRYYLNNKLAPIKEFVAKDVQAKRNDLKVKIEKELKGSKIEYISKVCPGCHSSETWDTSFGKPLDTTVLQELISKHKHISCVLFYGGEWNEPELIKLFEVCELAKLKICLYTGRLLSEMPVSILMHLDTIKVGPYIKELGGMQSPTTNQCYIKLK